MLVTCHHVMLVLPTSRWIVLYLTLPVLCKWQESTHGDIHMTNNGDRELSSPSVTGSTRTFLIDGGPRVRKAWSSCAALRHRVVAAGSSTRGLLWERLGSSCRARKRWLRRRCRSVRAAALSACKRRECRVDSRRSACHMPAPCYPNKARIKHIYVRTG